MRKQWKERVIIPVYKKAVKLNVVITAGCPCYQLHAISIILLARLSPYADAIICAVNVGFNVRAQTLIIQFAFISREEMRVPVH
jgi:hypothetical protein